MLTGQNDYFITVFRCSSFSTCPYQLTGNNTVKHPMEIFGIDNNLEQHVPC